MIDYELNPAMEILCFELRKTRKMDVFIESDYSDEG